jgi:hypothetical protein
MAEVIDAISTFIREYPQVVLGIIALGVLYLVLDVEFTLLCPLDGSTMRRVEDNAYECRKCGFVKRI